MYEGGMRLPVIRTERLTLCGMGERHLDDFTRIQYDPRVIPWFGGDTEGLPTDPVQRREDTWRVMAMFLGHWALRGYGQWALELRHPAEDTAERFIGRAGLWNPEGWPGLEVGWLIDPEHQGRGYATEAAVAAIDFAFDRLGRDEVISITVPHNTASRRVMEKAGLTDTGTTVQVRGHEHVLYRITREDWLAQQPRPVHP
jgi:RimJ/RimL family protein N-acetyltransferase